MDEARAKYTESLAIFLEQESHLLAACTYYFLGYLDRIIHRYESALHNFVNGLMLFTRMGNVGSIVGSVTEIAKVAMAKRQYIDACRLFSIADFLRESIGETQWKALPEERKEYDQHITLLRHNLGNTLFKEIWQEGQQTATSNRIGYISDFVALQGA